MERKRNYESTDSRGKPSSKNDRQYPLERKDGDGEGKLYEKFVSDVRAINGRYCDYERRRVNEGKDPWPAYRMLISNIEAGIRESLPKLSFRKILAERRAQYGQTFVLDVMGPGGFVKENYPVDGEVAITLVDHRDSKTQMEESRKGKEVVAGDVLDSQTWEKVKQYLADNDTREDAGFDLITCSPAAGWDLLRGRTCESSHFFRQIERNVLQNIVNVLSPQQGTLYMRHSLFREEQAQWDEWVNMINDGIGYQASLDGEVLQITRYTQDAFELPHIAA